MVCSNKTINIHSNSNSNNTINIHSNSNHNIHIHIHSNHNSNRQAHLTPPLVHEAANIPASRTVTRVVYGATIYWA